MSAFFRRKRRNFDHAVLFLFLLACLLSLSLSLSLSFPFLTQVEKKVAVCVEDET